MRWAAKTGAAAVTYLIVANAAGNAQVVKLQTRL
jgi:hypothetical protein